MSWSLSRLKLYEKCAAQYKYRYLEQLPYTTGAAAGRGLGIHAAVEMFFKRELERLPPEIDYYTQFFTYLRDNEDLLTFPEVKLAVTPSWEPCEWDDGWWRGILDLKVLHEDKLVVYDWKTGKIYDDHADDRELYSIAALSHNPTYSEVTTVYVYLDQRENRQTVYHRDHIGELQARWEKRVAKMERDDELIPSPGFYCRYCSYSKARGGPCQF